MAGLAKYIFFVKNLRGILVALEKSELERQVSWLTKRFRYRDIGVPEQLAKTYADVFRGRLNGNPFHVVDYPVSEARRAAETLVELLASKGVDPIVGTGLTLSLYYACPLLASQRVIEMLDKAGLIVHVVRGPGLSAQDAKLHIRIAGYSVLDSLVSLSERARECLCNGVCSVETLMDERKRFTENDSKRYWRIAGKGDKPVIAYIEVLKAIRDPKPYCSGETSVLLAMPVAFNLDVIG